ncbi:inorganic polyphosphate kinase [Candidatus Acidianus copahuensis]|uniref:NAD kinase n=1 Tax=Candidatus Acidianus copahuensis TaxID=1160895 RepID=A0A031LLG0_9CREN|nr:NAD(+)/NADH kinase [Candidatus Acidianus copahuensis]EZQ02074.1 inorganic polyphosphate kinase [Candidatus Acidianus copahuensis]
MKVKIVHNPFPKAQSIVRKALEIFKNYGLEITDSDPDYVIAIGGDGTLLKAIKYGKPVIAVKAGRRGFLMDVEPERLECALKRLIDGDFKIQEYPLLKLNTEGINTLAFNEVGIISEQPETIILNFKSDNINFSIEGDGALISTPQGSTGWALSATGNIILDVDAIELAFINPVLSPLRSVVISSNPITIKIEDKGYNQKIRLTSDGDIVETVNTGDEIHVERAKEKAKVLRFFEINPIGGVLSGKNNI